MNIDKVTTSLRHGYEKLSIQNAIQKNAALQSVIVSLNKNRNEIFEANKIDVDKARSNGMSEPLIDRLSLDNKKLDSIIEGINAIIQQTDPIGQELTGWKTPNGLQIKQIRVPIGVVAIIYENRPNVTVDAFCLAYKSGNSILLRSSSSALHSNKAIVKAIKEGLSATEGGFGIPEAIELAPCESHDEVEQILTAVGKIDLALPRGGQNLIKMVVEKAKVPVIETGSGICHLYVDSEADLDMAVNIAENGKIQRPGVCNSLECIVVNKSIASDFLNSLICRFDGKVKLHCDDFSYNLIQSLACFQQYKDLIFPATEEDFLTEFLDYECAIKSVDNVSEAISFINSHNTKHSESIITNNLSTAKLFQQCIDASCVYVNASTRFTDGGEFGFGTELGISTQKLHARGPMGISTLTTCKYLIDGDGQIR